LNKQGSGGNPVKKVKTPKKKTSSKDEVVAELAIPVINLHETGMKDIQF